MKILITIGEDIIARNIVFTPSFMSFLNDFQNNIVLVVDENKKDIFKQKTSNLNLIIEGYGGHKASKIEDMIMSIARSSLDTKTNLWSKMRSYKRGDSTWIATVFKRFWTKLAGRSCLIKSLIRQLIALVGSNDDAIKRIFDVHEPAGLIALSLTNFNFDVPIAREAKRRGVKVVGFVRSWDNLSSHGLLRVVPDVFLLQNNFLAEMARSVQCISKNVPIHIYGVPHYDGTYNYVPTENKETLAQRLGIDSKKKIIMYGAMGEFLFLNEMDLPMVFEKMISEGFLSDDIHFVFRAHPKFMVTDEMRGLKHVTFDTGGTYIKKSNDSQNDWDDLKNLIYWSEIVLTGASTIAIDATMLGKRVICVGFDGAKSKDKVDYWESVERFYDTYTHFEKLLESGVFPIVYSKDELVEKIKNTIGKNDYNLSQREEILKELVGKIDGRAGLRLVEQIKQEIKTI